MMALTQEKELAFGRGAHSGSSSQQLLAGLWWRGRSRQTENSNQRTKESLRRVMSPSLCVSGRESDSDGKLLLSSAPEIPTPEVSCPPP